MNSDMLLDEFRNMTLLELANFIRQFEETFGVTATTPAPPPPETPAREPEPEEQTEFTLTVESAGNPRIPVIRIIREVGKLGLAEAKAFTDTLPRTLLTGVSRDTAAEVAAKLTAAGAAVTIR